MKVCNTSRVIDKIVVAVLFDLLPLFRRIGFVFFFVVTIICISKLEMIRNTFKFSFARITGAF